MELKFILESLLFSAQKPLSVKELRDVLTSAAEHQDADATAKSFKKTKDEDLTAALEQLAREHEAGAGKPRDMGQGRDHKRQPECSATMPPEKLCQPTREKPAARIISAKAAGRGN